MISVQYSHLLPSAIDHALIFATPQLINQYSWTTAVVFPTRLRLSLLARDLVTWQAMEVRHILEENIEIIKQYVDERCLKSK